MTHVSNVVHRCETSKSALLGNTSKLLLKRTRAERGVEVEEAIRADAQELGNIVVVGQRG